MYLCERATYSTGAVCMHAAYTSMEVRTVVYKCVHGYSSPCEPCCRIHEHARACAWRCTRTRVSVYCSVHGVAQSYCVHGHGHVRNSESACEHACSWSHGSVCPCRCVDACTMVHGRVPTV
eukprot:363865-Chlamydomonas_euryale.AAC.20